MVSDYENDYEKRRELTIARNKEMLKSLGLDKPFFELKEIKRTKKAAPMKRKSIAEDDISHSAKVARRDLPESGTNNDTPPAAVRRSSRNEGKKVDYKAEQQRAAPLPVSFTSGIRDTENTGPLRQGGKRVHDPKTFGSIPAVEVGSWWETRRECSEDAIHAPWVGGISGSIKGAYSVALSGGYPDDVDWGYAFTYTGSGGRDLKGTKAAPKNLRTAPQSSDQDFANPFNQMLKVSSETRKPVRVIRGFKLKSPYAPYEGYRYDGLYIVEKAWMEKGLNDKGYLVCKFAFKRLPGQPPLPRRETTEETGADAPAGPEDDAPASDCEEGETA
ncbi:PUA-like domain-containing protein [Mycena sp. CBHHK59/15]|nr:PUA-like domain-containing protein [Mycena sp. CBHHK59/15]